MMQNSSQPVHSKKVFLTAAMCNAQLELPLSSFTQMVIDIATEHANILDIGYTRMLRDNATWVLSRLVVEMERFPRYNETFSITTWILTLNKYYSDRAIRFDDENGNPIGFVRTTWVAIDVNTRRPVNLNSLFPDGVPMPEIDFPIEPQPRIARIDLPQAVRSHTFLTADIDCNRHVNTNRYVEQIINQWDLAFYDDNRICRFDVTFHAEALFGEAVTLQSTLTGSDATVEIINSQGRLCTAAAILFEKR